jgi:hypothetical protein
MVLLASPQCLWPIAPLRFRIDCLEYDARLTGVPDKVIQAILRHSNVSVTLGYYVKPQTPDVIAAMDKFEAEIAAHNFGDSNGTVNPPLGSMPKSVN